MWIGVRGFLSCLTVLLLASCGDGQVEEAVVIPASVVSEADTSDTMVTAGASDSPTALPEFADLGEAERPEAFTAESAARVGSQRVAETQHMLYANDAELVDIVSRASTVDGRRALRTLIDDELAPVRNALATAPAATTWFLVRPLSVSVPVVDDSTGRASMTVWSMELFSRVGVTDPEMMFFETDVGLVWNGSQWLLDGFEVRPGPVARLAREQYPITAPELTERLSDHRLVDPVTLNAWGIEA